MTPLGSDLTRHGTSESAEPDFVNALLGSLLTAQSFMGMLGPQNG